MTSTIPLQPVTISTVEDIVADMRAGRIVILVDEEDRENEGDLVIAADHITADSINFMARHARGLICLTLSRALCERLQLPPMVARNGAKHATAFTVSIEAAEGVTTGISAADRARTVQAAVAPNATAADLVQPGHIFPLQAVDGGVLMRAGHTEAGCDLSVMAGCSAASVICEVMNDDGTMGSRQVETAFGNFTAHAFRDKPSQGVHLALVKGSWQPDETIPTRVHEPLSVLDVLEVNRSLHSWSLDASLRHIAAEGQGVAVLLNCGESAADLLAQFSGTARPAQAPERGQMDLRTYGIGAQILLACGVRKMQLLGSPRRSPGLTGYGLETTGYLSPPQQEHKE
jgi:3,4-dihydroxy 2-butanone 4-phosphate synthase/GTP cyclohydrolase II